MNALACGRRLALRMNLAISQSSAAFILIKRSRVLVSCAPG